MSTTTKTSADAKREFAQALMVKMGINPSSGKAPVIVLPEFFEENGEWVPSDEDAAIASNGTKGFGYVALFQSRTVKLKGVEFDNDLWAIQRGKLTSLAAKYTPGMTLPGNIVSEDTLVAPNPANPQQDLKYFSAACRELNQPLMIGDQPIYTIRYWDETGEVADIHLEATNVEECRKLTEGARAAANKPATRALTGAARRAALKS